MLKNYDDFLKYSEAVNNNCANLNKTKLLVSLGTCGIAAGADKVLSAIKKKINARDLSNQFEIIETGCMGLCHSEPTVEVQLPQSEKPLIFGNVKPEDADIILNHNTDTKASVQIIPQNWYYPEDSENKDNMLQAKIALKNTGKIDPQNIDAYIHNSGYTALAKSLFELSPEKIINIITDSGLRGRGGGGFPTGKKWSFAASQNADQKYIICNADEGDPGAFMDRAVLEGDPHSVLEAMTIAGYAINATKGYIYIRAEYPLAIERLQQAIKQSTNIGFLGKNILNSDFDFEIELRYGAGAFVCGEETALINSIEGLRGMPSNKPPFPAVEGLWKKPTIVNNVETFANICAIIRKGAEWFRNIGTDKSPGTKVFALAGKIRNVGLIEVPMGTKLEDIIYKIGNGIPNNKQFKAVQTGGPSGGCITAQYLHTEIDYDSLKVLGSMMGSGGMIVMDEEDCMVNIAKFFLEFTIEESCGKCTPCRLGGLHMHKILTKITDGSAEEKDLLLLEQLSDTIKTSSLCGLGMTAPNPVISTIKYFKDEYIEHIIDKKCRAGKCQNLISYKIDENKCIGCTACAKRCPVGCITGTIKKPHHIDHDKCIKCGECFHACKFDAVSKL